MSHVLFLGSRLGLVLSCSVAVPAIAGDAADQPQAEERVGPANAQAAVTSGPPAAPPSGRPPSVFDGDWITLGVGVGVGPSYDGSDDYTISPAPVLQGSVSGIRINARPAGLAADLIRDGDGPVNFSFGPTFRLRSDRASDIQDEVVELAGELDRAFEVGVSGGIGVSGVLRRRDSLSLDVDIRWDVAGAHGGQVIAPGITYFTPFGRGVAASLSIGAQFVDDDFADYYYSVNPEQSVASGLAEFQAQGGLNSIGGNALVIVDFDGNLANGGLSGVIITGYSRLQGDSVDTPYTSERGSANQLFGALGIAYTF